MKLKGKAWKFGSNIDTDVIIPARYLNTTDPDELAKHCMEDIDKDFVKKIDKGDIIVADTNFGCGSSREHAPVSIKAAGISCVIAKTFARIFYRNAINTGLPIIECQEASDRIDQGDEVRVEIKAGRIENLTKKEEYTTNPFPSFMQELISAGGLMPYVAKKEGLKKEEG
jgi:3-isopropylmalate/(R)-2-methylmalate dehydratase small subunit